MFANIYRKLQVLWYKRKLKKSYLKMIKIEDKHDCGSNLLENVSLEYYYQKSKVETYKQKLISLGEKI